MHIPTYVQLKDVIGETSWNARDYVFKDFSKDFSY